MNRSIDSDLLRAFILIHTTGSFSSAGARLGRTQAAISLQIQRLEELLGKPVFERTSRRLSLSPAGEILLGYAQKILELNDEALLRIRENDIAGILRIGAPEALAAAHLPRILSLFSREHPAIRLDVTCGLTEELLKNFNEGAYDIVIFKRDARTQKLGTLLWKEKLSWACGREKRPDLSKTVPVILSPAPCIYRKTAITCLEQKGIDWQNSITAHSLTGRISAAREGLGITLVPEYLIDEGLLALDEKDGLPVPGSLEMAVLTKKESTSPMNEEFIRHLTGYFSAMPPGKK